jgi:MurNAc alpha-1-phosphate uridylyltransferase
MKAMILAAGRGERLRPLTDHTPKPLLRAGGKALIAWHLERLAAAGWREVVINHAHLGEQIEAALGDGSSFGLQHHVLAGTCRGPGNRRRHRRRAAPARSQPFLAVNGDIWCDWDFARARACARRLATNDAPTSCWSTTRRIIPAAISASTGDSPCWRRRNASDTATYAGIGVFWPEFFAAVPAARDEAAPLLDDGISRGIITGERHRGRWVDVGTPERLAELDRELA